MSVATSVEAAAIKLQEDRRYQAMIAGDRGGLDEVLDADLIYTHSNGLREDKAQYVGGVVSGRFDYQRIERFDEHIRIEGAAALVSGRVEIDVVVGGQLRHLNSMFLDVWVKREQGWRMLAWQSTPLPAAG